MLDFLNSLKSLIKNERIHTDNNIFKLHCRFTVIVLIAFSILVTSKQYFGDPIDCDVEDSKKNVIDTYCWIYGTYIIRDSLKDEILPGLGNYANYRAREFNENQAEAWKDVMKPDGPNDSVIWQKYYQWVGVFFCIQAILFYIPRYLWKTWEGGRIRLLVNDLGGPLISPTWSRDNKERLISYMLSGKYSHTTYCCRFVVCEVLNLVNVIVQIALIDWFLNSQFFDFGFAFSSFNTVNPFTRVFPKLTKCTYFKYGPSGSMQSRDALCVLSLNIVNEKLFVFLWFWFYILAILSFIAVIYRSLILFIPRFRVFLLMAQARYLTRSCAEVIVKRLSVGDYFVLHQLGKNINPLIYKDLVTGISSTLMNKTNLSYNPEVTIPI